MNVLYTNNPSELINRHDFDSKIVSFPIEINKHPQEHFSYLFFFFFFN
jgi:hypothetical protein